MTDPRTTHPYLRLTCHSCPVLIEGKTPDGNQIRFRYRHGHAAFAVNDEPFWSARLGDDLDGCIEEDQALRLVAALVDLHTALGAIQASRTTVDPAALKAEMERVFGLPSSPDA